MQDASLAPTGETCTILEATSHLLVEADIDSRTVKMKAIPSRGRHHLGDARETVGGETLHVLL